MLPLRGQITPHFAWDELVREDDWPHVTNAHVLAMRNLAWFVLQPLRDRLQASITVNSCFRTPAHNARVGGAPHSQHLNGEAADISASPDVPTLVLAQAATTVNAFKIGVYQRHIHVAIPSIDVKHHIRPARWGFPVIDRAWDEA